MTDLKTEKFLKELPGKLQLILGMVESNTNLLNQLKALIQDQDRRILAIEKRLSSLDNGHIIH